VDARLGKLTKSVSVALTYRSSRAHPETRSLRPGRIKRRTSLTLALLT